MVDPSAESTYKAADAMMTNGGSFVKELGAAWYVADPINKAKLCLTFEHYFVKYGAKSDGAAHDEKQYNREECFKGVHAIITLLNSDRADVVENTVLRINAIPGLRSFIEDAINPL